MSLSRFALIVAGGSGVRMGTETPKQFMLLDGIPILMHTIGAFSKTPNKCEIILVLPDSETPRWKNLCKEFSFQIPHTVVEGGSTRFHSVKNGLNVIDDEGYVAIHDGVRPLVSTELIEECFKVANDKGNAIPAVKPSESVRIGAFNENNSLDRNTVWLIQTPQVFRVSIIKSYYSKAQTDDFTDDASLAQTFGEKIFLVEGFKENIKITTPVDLTIAASILEGKKKSF